MLKKKRKNLPQDLPGDYAEQPVEAPDLVEGEEDTAMAEDRTEESQVAPSPTRKALTLTDRFDEWSRGCEIDSDTCLAARAVIAMIETAMREEAVDEALFDILVKGAGYDRAMTDAFERGEIKGRNARIEELIKEEADGDGVPHPTGGAIGPDRNPSIFDLARNAW